MDYDNLLMNSYVNRKQWEIPGDNPINDDQVCCTVKD